MRPADGRAGGASSAEDIPVDKMRRAVAGAAAECVPYVLIEDGSFNPVTYMHLALMERAKRHIEERRRNAVVIGGYLSPVGDAYGKPQLAAAAQRVAMCCRATERSEWLGVSRAAARRREYQPSFAVCREIADVAQRVWDSLSQTTTSLPVVPVLVCGGDLLLSMRRWRPENVRALFDSCLVAVLPRERGGGGGGGGGGADELQHMLRSELLRRRRSRVLVMDSLSRDDDGDERLCAISSSALRARVAARQSIDDLTPAAVGEYIRQHALYERVGGDALESAPGADSPWALHSRT